MSLKLLRLDIDNFMGLRAVSITPDGNMVQITGKNGQGKSAIINALFAALFGKSAIPADPVRHGESEARIRLDLGEVVVRLSIDPEGESKLLVESAGGARFPSPQTMLGRLLGARTFDAGSFLAMKPKEQCDELARLVGLSDMLADTSAKQAADYEQRTVVNRRVKELTAQVDAVLFDGVAVVPVDVAGVVASMRDAEQHNNQVSANEKTRDRHLAMARSMRSDMERRQREIAMLVSENDRVAQDVAAIDVLAESVHVGERIETSLMQQQIIDAQSINDKARRIEERKKLAEKRDAARLESEAITERMEQRDAEKTAVIAAASMPVPGLSLSDECVMLNGVPFEQEHTAARIRASVGIGMASNPELRVMVIRDGSMFDNESVSIIEEMAGEHDYLVIMERVRDDDTVGIVIQGGEVVKVNKQRAEVPV